MAEEWSLHHVGGPMAPTTMWVHRACGAFIYDRVVHKKVCPAPPYVTDEEIGKVMDWMQGGGVVTNG